VISGVVQGSYLLSIAYIRLLFPWMAWEGLQPGIAHYLSTGHWDGQLKMHGLGTRASVRLDSTFVRWEWAVQKGEDMREVKQGRGPFGYVIRSQIRPHHQHHVKVGDVFMNQSRSKESPDRDGHGSAGELGIRRRWVASLYESLPMRGKHRARTWCCGPIPAIAVAQSIFF